MGCMANSKCDYRPDILRTCIVSYCFVGLIRNVVFDGSIVNIFSTISSLINHTNYLTKNILITWGNRFGFELYSGGTIELKSFLATLTAAGESNFQIVDRRSSSEAWS